MRKKSQIFAVGVLALVSVQGVCAVNYQLQMNDNDPKCIQFINAVKTSHIEDMTDQQLCEAINRPVTGMFPGSLFKELDWVHDPLVDIVAVAKNTVEAAEPATRLGQSPKSHADWLQEVARLSAAHHVEVAYGRVQLTHNTFYVVQLTESVCDASYNKHGPLPFFGFFSDPAHLHGVRNPPLVDGQLVYFDGHLASVYLSPAWISDPGSNRPKLFVSMQYRIDDKANGSLRSGLKESCPILIQK